MDWTLFATIASPIATLLLGAWLSQRMERRPRLVTFMSHATAVPIQSPEGESFSINSHSIVVRNVGRRAAHNVRLGHDFLPQNYVVWPQVAYETVELKNGGWEILFPTLVPGEQITVTYLYQSPITFQRINTHTKSDEGYAEIVLAIEVPPSLGPLVTS